MLKSFILYIHYKKKKLLMKKYFVTKSSISFVKHLSTKNALCHFSHPRPIAKSIPTKIIFHYLNVFTNEIKNFISEVKKGESRSKTRVSFLDHLLLLNQFSTPSVATQRKAQIGRASCRERV